MKKTRYRVIVLGGGIHGVGIAHDLASRGWKDVLVVEKDRIGSGTSSRSTKLIHGGLRYLENPSDYPLVVEGLRERKLLMTVAPDLVKPLEFIFPIQKGVGRPAWMIRIGLTLYDLLAMNHSIGRHHSISDKEVLEKASILNVSRYHTFYSFQDGQTDDLALTKRVASSASKLGAELIENTSCEKIAFDAEGFKVHCMRGGQAVTLSSRYVVNAAGPWAHKIMAQSDITPQFNAINNKGAHVIVRDLGLKAGVFLQSPDDGRIFFILPWLGKTLIGTTETSYDENLDSVKTSDQDCLYLIDRCNQSLNIKLGLADIESRFSGLRWLATSGADQLRKISRSHQVSCHKGEKGQLYTIYGGKLTAYRALCEEIGDLICKDYGDSSQSQTHLSKSWTPPGGGLEGDVIKRFESYG
jgi:glycerol-3-phosphate dehydrogenase